MVQKARKRSKLRPRLFSFAIRQYSSAQPITGDRWKKQREKISDATKMDWTILKQCQQTVFCVPPGGVNCLLVLFGPQPVIRWNNHNNHTIMTSHPPEFTIRRFLFHLIAFEDVGADNNIKTAIWPWQVVH